MRTLSENIIYNLQSAEMLVGFRGKYKFKVYIPSKPNKYIMSLVDARNSYFYNAYVYCSKGSYGATWSSKEKSVSIPTQTAIRLSKSIENTHRNITDNFWFSSYELVNGTRKRGLTFDGTLRKNKTEIPQTFFLLEEEIKIDLFMISPKKKLYYL